MKKIIYIRFIIFDGSNRTIVIRTQLNKNENEEKNQEKLLRNLL